MLLHPPSLSLSSTVAPTLSHNVTSFPPPLSLQHSSTNFISKCYFLPPLSLSLSSTVAPTLSHYFTSFPLSLSLQHSSTNFISQCYFIPPLSLQHSNTNFISLFYHLNGLHKKIQLTMEKKKTVATFHSWTLTSTENRTAP